MSLLQHLIDILPNKMVIWKMEKTESIITCKLHESKYVGESLQMHLQM